MKIKSIINDQSLIILLYFLFLVFPFGQLFKVQLSPSINLHILDVVSLSLVICYLLRRDNHSWPRFTRPLVSFWVVAVFSLILASASYNWSQVFAAALYLGRFVVYSSLYFVFDFLFSKDSNLKKKITDGLLTVGASVSIFGLIQYLMFPDARPLKEFGWDPHMYRLFATFLDPAFAGILVVFYLLLVFSIVFVQGFKKKYAVLLFVGLGALYLTYSRASYLAFLAGLGALLVTRGKRKVFIISSLLFLFSLLFLPRLEGAGNQLERLSTVVARVENYKETVEVIYENPLFGVGFNFYRYAAGRNSDTHSGAGADLSLLFVFATTGVVGGLVYLGMISKILRRSWLTKESFEGLALLSSSSALLVHSLFSNTLFYPWVIVWISVLMGFQIRKRR